MEKFFLTIRLKKSIYFMMVCPHYIIHQHFLLHSPTQALTYHHHHHNHNAFTVHLRLQSIEKHKNYYLNLGKIAYPITQTTSFIFFPSSLPSHSSKISNLEFEIWVIINIVLIWVSTNIIPLY